MLAPPKSLDKAGISKRVPHGGPMCLLDRVVSWNSDAIHAQSDGQQVHPLAIDGHLDSTAAIEYAAQAMAAHGALLGELAAAQGQQVRTPTLGFLASVRSVVCHKPYITAAHFPIEISATRVAGTDSPVSYEFDVSHNGAVLVSGKATVVLNYST
jgi:predicted hotdog family 3-hydroxylacyl-ACP dehydratase